jgi:hypothetical protein
LVLGPGSFIASPVFKLKGKATLSSGMIRIFRWESVILEGITLSGQKIRFGLFQQHARMPDVGLALEMVQRFNAGATVRNSTLKPASRLRGLPSNH